MKATPQIRNTNSKPEYKSEDQTLNFDKDPVSAECAVRIVDFLRASDFGLRMLLALACGVAVSGCAERKEAPDETAPKVEGNKITFSKGSPQIESLVSATAEMSQSRTARMTGRLVWNDDVTVRVFPPVSGRIGSIMANPGQRVSAGEVLAKIASPEFGQAQAAARKAIADLKLAEHSLNRIRELQEHGAAAQKDLESAEAEHARAVSEKERALATVALYGGEWDSGDDFCSLKAPIDGVVVEKSINPGQEVRADQVGAESKSLFVISNPSRLWVVLDATEADLSSLRPGAEIKLRSQTYPGQLFAARIEVISDYVDPNSRTIKVRGTVDNSQRLLKAEMFVNAELSAPIQPGVNVRSSAIFLKGDKHYAFIEAAEGIFLLQQVNVGPEQDGITLVTVGLQQGQRVVTDGALLLNQILVENAAQTASAPLALAHD